jgi:hypothetical protein
MKLLSSDRSYNIIEIEDFLGIDERTFYRYQKAMEEMNYYLICENGKYRQNKDKSSFTLTQYSKHTFVTSIRFDENKIDLLKIYNLISDVQATELPSEFMEQFVKDFQEFYLN